MKIKRMAPQSYTKPLPKALDSKEVSILWCNDGWSYIPARYVRFRYSHETQIYEEVCWSGSIPAKVEYEEQIKWILYSKSPRIWQENGPGYSELFVENG